MPAVSLEGGEELVAQELGTVVDSPEALAVSQFEPFAVHGAALFVAEAELLNRRPPGLQDHEALDNFRAPLRQWIGGENHRLVIAFRSPRE